MESQDLTQKASLKFSRRDARKDLVESIVRWNAVPKLEGLLQPFPLLAAKVCNRDEVIGTPDHCADTDHEKADRRTLDLASTWVDQARTMHRHLGINRNE